MEASRSQRGHRPRHSESGVSDSGDYVCTIFGGNSRQLLYTNPLNCADLKYVLSYEDMHIALVSTGNKNHLKDLPHPATHCRQE